MLCVSGVAVSWASQEKQRIGSSGVSPAGSSVPDSCACIPSFVLCMYVLLARFLYISSWTWCMSVAYVAVCSTVYIELGSFVLNNH